MLRNFAVEPHGPREALSHCEHLRGPHTIDGRSGAGPPVSLSPRCRSTGIRRRSGAGSQSLLRKLRFREGHPLLPWVRSELSQRFDYHCCDSIEEFQHSRGLALTRSRHTKSGNKRHGKDDRDEAVDPRNFVLGWDNREKKLRIVSEIERLLGQEAQMNDQIAGLDGELCDLQKRLSVLQIASSVSTFAEIDHGRHEREITALEREKLAIEEASDTIKLLKGRLAEFDSKISALQGDEKQAIGQEALLDKEITDADRLIANARADLRRSDADGSLTRHRECFAELESFFHDTPLAVDHVFEQQKELERGLRARVDKLRVALRPVEEELLRSMNNFLREFPEERADLDTGIDYLEGFLGLRQRIADEDLPRHERRFKERLNEKVIQELGLYNGALERERRSIQDKIETLNVSLKRLEYRPGTHIQLEPRPVRDPRKSSSFN